MDPVETTRRIIAANRYMTLATCGDNEPWASPVAYAVDVNYSFYWYSAVDARHSINISKNPLASAAIFNSTEPSDTVDGLQIAGRAAMVEADHLADLMDIYWQQQFPDREIRERWRRDKSDFTGSARQRFYVLVPSEVYKVDTTATKVDRRVPLELSTLREESAR